MQIHRFINLTPSPVQIWTGERIVTIPPDAGGRLRVEHVDDPDRGAYVIAYTRDDIDQIPVHPALWDSPNAGGLGVDGLPDPEPGVAILVTGHVAEVAALMGREIDDLFVPLERHKRDDGSRSPGVWASLCPAKHATPGMTAIRYYVEQWGKPVLKKPGVRGCYTIAGYDVRTVIEVRDCFGADAIFELYPRLTRADLESIRRWEASHARAG